MKNRGTSSQIPPERSYQLLAFASSTGFNHVNRRTFHLTWRHSGQRKSRRRLSTLHLPLERKATI